MGAQLSRNKKDAKRHGHVSYPSYPPYPYWPGQPMQAVIPPGYPQPGMVPSSLPWPAANQQTYKRRRKRTRKKAGRKGDRGGLPAGFGKSQHFSAESTSSNNTPVPTGFVSAPQPVAPPPGSMSRATSQGQPPPLFTPGPNNSQHLTSFPSPQIPTTNVGGPGANTSAMAGTSRTVANRRAPTPFIPRQEESEDDSEDDSDSHGTADFAPVIPQTTDHHHHSTRSRRGGHRHTASMPAAAPMLFQQPPGYNPLLPPLGTTMPRRPNPLPEPPRVLFDRTPFKRLVDLPGSGPPYFTAVNPTVTTALTALTAAAGIPGAVAAGVGVGGEAGMAGVGAGGGGTQKKKSRLMRAFSRGGSNKGQAQGQGPGQGMGISMGGAHDYMGSLVPVARVIPVVVADNSGQAAAAAAMASTSTSTGGGGPVIPPPVPSTSSNPAATTAATTAAVGAAGSTTPQPPLRYTSTGPYSPLSIRSAHPIIYQGKEYPTAMHLYHAMEVIDRFPETAEMMRLIPPTDFQGLLRAASRAREEGKVREGWDRDFLAAVSIVVSSDLRLPRQARTDGKCVAYEDGPA